MAKGKSLVVTSLYATSDIGNVRDNNEDNFIIANLTSGETYNFPQSVKAPIEKNQLLMAVSDGMGGAQGGEIAAAIAVYALKLELMRLFKSQVNESEVDLLIKALEKVNQIIWQTSRENDELQGMGATITAVFVSGSRAYVIRNKKIKQITTDQSLFEMLSQTGSFEGRLPSENTRNIILQSMGGQEKIHVAVTTLEIQLGDYLLLCSDGLSNMLTSDEICNFISTSPNLERAGARMIDLAKERGADDNITVVVANFEGNALSKDTNRSITQSIEILTAFNPLTRDVEKRVRRITQQMGSGELNLGLKGNPNLIFRSTLGIMPPSEYPYRTQALNESDKSIELLYLASRQLSVIVGQIQQLEGWLEKQGCLDPSLQKAIVHLEYAVKNTQKIEIVARKARALIERLSTKSSHQDDK
jgi:protein phosphatase